MAKLQTSDIEAQFERDIGETDTFMDSTNTTLDPNSANTYMPVQPPSFHASATAGDNIQAHQTPTYVSRALLSTHRLEPGAILELPYVCKNINKSYHRFIGMSILHKCI